MYHIDIDVKRGRNFQLLAQVAYYCHSIPEQVFPSLQKLEAWVSDPTPLSATFKEDIKNVMQAFWDIVNDAESELAAAFTRLSQRVAPAEFVFIGKYSGFLY